MPYVDDGGWSELHTILLAAKKTDSYWDSVARAYGRDWGVRNAEDVRRMDGEMRNSGMWNCGYSEEMQLLLSALERMVNTEEGSDEDDTGA